MNACVCGHAVEDHPNDGACTGDVVWDGEREWCRCVHYEEAEE